MLTKGSTASRRLFCSLLLVLTFAGCERKSSPAIDSMTTEQIILHYRDTPVSDSIDSVAKSLSKQSVYVGTEEVAKTEDGELKGTLRLRTGLDNQGRPWVYAYTSETNLSSAFPNGSPFVEMSFANLFKIVEPDQKFAGIYLNSSSDTFYPIPRELFVHLKQSFSNH